MAVEDHYVENIDVGPSALIWFESQLDDKLRWRYRFVVTSLGGPSHGPRSPYYVGKAAVTRAAVTWLVGRLREEPSFGL